MIVTNVKAMSDGRFYRAILSADKIAQFYRQNQNQILLLKLSPIKSADFIVRVSYKNRPIFYRPTESAEKSSVRHRLKKPDICLPFRLMQIAFFWQITLFSSRNSVKFTTYSQPLVLLYGTPTNVLLHYVTLNYSEMYNKLCMTQER